MSSARLSVHLPVAHSLALRSSFSRHCAWRLPCEALRRHRCQCGISATAILPDSARGRFFFPSPPATRLLPPSPSIVSKHFSGGLFADASWTVSTSPCPSSSQGTSRLTGFTLDATLGVTFAATPRPELTTPAPAACKSPACSYEIHTGGMLTFVQDRVCPDIGKLLSGCSHCAPHIASLTPPQCNKSLRTPHQRQRKHERAVDVESSRGSAHAEHIPRRRAGCARRRGFGGVSVVHTGRLQVLILPSMLNVGGGACPALARCGSGAARAWAWVWYTGCAETVLAKDAKDVKDRGVVLLMDLAGILRCKQMALTQGVPTLKISDPGSEK
ncbi:hypothetical protein GGX14DRAFT_392528 [Mycena pura]|uniref:Uncharacterized protein n=1 Tax=Mycena pura TaxID=153505 RepID=A0AAD6VJA4_9AGAR|nr:hypothetical protein GGX14DRAFT_392528 [Mycena pura]